MTLSKNNVYHERTKHVDVKYHFIREKIEESVVTISKISTFKNHADTFTKTLLVNKVAEALKVLQLCFE